jgi:hypothetical protein
MSRFDAAHQQEMTARHNLLNRLHALEKATVEQTRLIAEGHSPDMRQVNRRWLALDEAMTIHRACLHAVDMSVMRAAQ